MLNGKKSKYNYSIKLLSTNKIYSVKNVVRTNGTKSLENFIFSLKNNFLELQSNVDNTGSII